MNKLSAKMTAAMKKYRSALKQGGFSMLEAVVVVGVLLALAVSGFIAYGEITKNAKKASTESAAASVYTAAIAAVVDGDSATDLADVATNYNDSQEAITVTVNGTTDSTISVDAVNDGDASITAHAGPVVAGP